MVSRDSPRRSQAAEDDLADYDPLTMRILIMGSGQSKKRKRQFIGAVIVLNDWLIKSYASAPQLIPNKEGATCSSGG